MRSGSLLFRTLALVVLTVFIQSILLFGISPAQTSGCDFDPDKPSIDHARMSFKMLNYRCAEEELNVLLAKETVDIEDKANAHVLLASVYYAMLKDNDEKRDRVMEEFVKAFKSYREWRGELDIKSSEFLDLMEAAKDQVDQESLEQAIEPSPDSADTVAPAFIPTTAEKKKPWYTKWWAIGAGVGVVALGVVVLAGGGDDGGTVDTLPYFPTTPD
ncbi:MAG: hypothetical protein JW763_08910 [candidate division Zixibacteria bacterium]|nr:hypothetical protein [candidate division Zixibacteria bacterium]